MMKKKSILALFMALGLFVVSCSNDDDNNESSTRNLTINFSGLENLGADFV